MQGFEVARRDARNDVSAQRLMHTLTQARLAAIGAYLGASIAVEPGKAGGPGDVLLRSPRGEVFLEIVSFGPDESRELDEGHQERHWMHLMALGRAGIHWDGYVPGFLNKADESKWLEATKEAAAECVRAGQPVEVPGPDRQRLTVRSGKQPAGTGTFGPQLNFDFSVRLTRILDRKGAQTRGAGVAWIWIEDYGGVHAVHPFTKLAVIGLFIWARIDDQRQRSFVTGYPGPASRLSGSRRHPRPHACRPLSASGRRGQTSLPWRPSRSVIDLVGPAGAAFARNADYGRGLALRDCDTQARR